LKLKRVFTAPKRIGGRFSELIKEGVISLPKGNNFSWGEALKGIGGIKSLQLPIQQPTPK